MYLHPRLLPPPPPLPPLPPPQANPDGIFTSLVDETGEGSAAFLKGVANGEIVLDGDGDEPTFTRIEQTLSSRSA